MFSSAIARLRRLATPGLVAALAFLPTATAHDDVLFASSVSYCAPPELVLVQQFDIVYFAANQSIFFNVSAASVESNVNVTANLLVNVYGMKPLNLTIDLCTILGGALCPLPTYNFTGSEILPLPSSIDVASDLPAIAYSIPDLEAVVQLTLTSVDTDEVKACIQSTLSNGWSTRQVGVQWAAGALALVALLSAVAHTLFASPEALAPFRFVELFALYQSIAASALLSLNYPVVYRAFAANFSWALGLFSARNGSKIQTAIDNLRHRTGGTMDDASGSGVELVNRQLSPYNNLNTLYTLDDVRAVSAKIFSTTTQALVRRAAEDNDEATLTVTSENVLEAGIPVWVSSLGISVANAFMSVFFALLILTAITLVVLALGWAVLALLMRWRAGRARDEKTDERLEEWKEYYPWFARAWALRLTLIAFLPVTLFALHQWTLKDSWLSTLFSVLTLLAVLGGLGYPMFLLSRLARREGRAWALYQHTPSILTAGPLYVQHRPARWWFSLFTLGALFARAIITAFGYSSGLAQVILLLLVELGLFLSIIVLKPHETRGGDKLAGTLAGARVLATGLSFAFVEQFGVSAIPRVVIGFVMLVVFGLAVILMAVNTVMNLGLRAVWRRVRAGRSGARELASGPGSREFGGDSEKGTPSGKASASQPELVSSRPRHPEPVTPITPASSASESTTLGEVLPPQRREFAGLGLGLDSGTYDLEEGGEERSARDRDSVASSRFSAGGLSGLPSIPSTPSHSSHASNAGAGGRRESWVPSTSLGDVPEGREAR